MSGITKFYTISERSKNRLKLQGFSEHEVSGLELYFNKAEALLKPFQAAMEKVRQDRTLSPEGKNIKIDALKAEMTGKVNGLVAGDFDKSKMIESLEQQQKTKVAQIRAANQPEDKVLAYLMQQELRQHLVTQTDNHFEKAQRVGATNAEKVDTDGPLVKAVVEAATKYVATPSGPGHYEQNRRSELVLSAIMNAPYDLIQQDLRERVEQNLATNLAIQESEQLRVVRGFHSALTGFGQDLKSMVAEA